MEINHFIGEDVSKGTLDFSVVNQGQIIFHLRVANINVEIEHFIK